MKIDERTLKIISEFVYLVVVNKKGGCRRDGKFCCKILKT